MGQGTHAIVNRIIESEIQTNPSRFPKLYRCLLYVVFHNLKSQNAGFVDVKKDLNSKRSKGIFVRENLKNKHSYKKYKWV